MSPVDQGSFAELLQRRARPEQPPFASLVDIMKSRGLVLGEQPLAPAEIERASDNAAEPGVDI
ncbi:hypothetical protein NVV95_08930 [Herbiconiux sp. CPCC 205716]|uniref:Uncharacterized protein n=1 Tax=Herbiconiux gentiana TaxID=2970912 RepID=A0ABT2GHB8_9MICO|nr:hypothetical protein [Herbiconiux gentiana]MCS5714675.1 hypothetical protein [Herbiconiux gentiana]